MASKRTKNNRLYYILLFCLGIALFSYGFYSQYAKHVLSFDYTSPTSTASETTNSINRVQIANLNIGLPVEESNIENGVWEISESGASHLSGSSNPTEGGNIIIYAHNQDNLFGPLRNISVGEEIVLKSGYSEFTYIVTDTFAVNPDNIAPVLPTYEEVLTLYTCTGFLDSKRYIVKAIPETKIEPNPLLE